LGELLGSRATDRLTSHGILYDTGCVRYTSINEGKLRKYANNAKTIIDVLQENVVEGLHAKRRKKEKI
jgi:hypothetical protein